MKWPTNIKSINVNAFGSLSGTLTHTAHHSFQYVNENVPPVSLSMRPRTDPWNHGVLHPVFTQNLPEGYVRHYIAERLQRSAVVNDMYLLAIQGSRGIGNLDYHSELDLPATDQLSLSEILQWDSEESLFSTLIDRYYFNGSVSGMQPKTLVDMEHTPLTQDSVIVKASDNQFEHLTINEFVCMEAAKEAGLNPPKVWLSDNRECFVIDRFDRVNGKQLALEDFSALMNTDKYHSSYEHLLKLAGLYTPDDHHQTERLYEQIVFSCLIGNGDAHLKNFCVTYEEGQQDIQVSPPYDITHTNIYPDLDGKLALKLGNSKRFPTREHLIKLGRGASINQPERTLERLADSIQTSIDASDEIKEYKGLYESIARSVRHGTSIAVGGGQRNVRRDRKLKHE